MFRAGEAIASTVNFFNFTALLELLDYAREKAAAAMPQIHAVSNLADADRLRERREMSDDLLGCDFRRGRGIAGLEGVAFAARAHGGRDRLADLRGGGKRWF